VLESSVTIPLMLQKLSSPDEEPEGAQAVSAEKIRGVLILLDCAFISYLRENYFYGEKSADNGNHGTGWIILDRAAAG
jgi:hypothetical protein